MSFDRLRNSRIWKPVSAIYRKTGLKARVCSHSLFKLPVKTVAISRFLEGCSRSQSPMQITRVEPDLKSAPSSGPMPAEDVEAIARIAIQLQPKRIFEFGTNWGYSTATFLLNTSPQTKIWTLDICQELLTEAEVERDPELQAMLLKRDDVGSVYKMLPESNQRATQIFQDSLKLDWHKGDFPNGFDLVLVDACHQYKFVKSDTAKALDRLAPSGLIIWHDYYPDVSAWPDVFRVVNEFAKVHEGVIHLRDTHIALWRRPA
jgi:predicted O-methyltransferase YrrM